MKSDGWEQIDTVRLILASIVAVAHILGIFTLPFGLISQGVADVSSDMAEYAVLAFFLISGLVIGRSLSRSPAFVKFMWRRIKRIYPPLLFSVALCVVLAVTLRRLGMDRYIGPATDLVRERFSYLDSRHDVLAALLTFGFRGGLTGSSNGPLWTLALEMQAYVFAGLAVQAIVARNLWIRAVAALALRYRGLAGLETLHFVCFGCFCAGLGLSLLPLTFPKMLPVPSLDFSYSLYILRFPIALFVFFLTCDGTPPAPVMIWLLIVATTLIVVAVSVLSGVIFEQRNWAKRLFGARDMIVPAG